MLRESQWSFETSSSVSYSVGRGFMGATLEFADIVLRDPSERLVTFTYGDIKGTLGISPGGKKDNRPPKTDKSGAVSTPDMTSVGKVYMMDAFAGQELSASDFEGPCMLGEISGSLKAIAATGTVLYFGIPPYKLLTEAATSPMGIGLTSLLCPGFGPLWGQVSDYVLEKSDILPSSIFQQGAKAACYFGGQGTSSSISLGVAGGFGFVSRGSVIPPAKIPPPPPVPKTPKKVITLPAEILFDFDKYSLKLESTIIGGIVASPTAVLWALANQIQQKPFSMVACHGYTDSCGEYGYNLGLSYNRAMSVKTWLTQMRVVPAERVICVPHSFADPAADNSTAEGRRLNRRVVVEVY